MLWKGASIYNVADVNLCQKFGFIEQKYIFDRLKQEKISKNYFIFVIKICSVYLLRGAPLMFVLSQTNLLFPSVILVPVLILKISAHFINLLDNSVAYVHEIRIIQDDPLVQLGNL